MTRGMDIYLFAGLAVLVHLGAWLGLASGGVQSAGSGGKATISLSAAPAQMAQMVELWDRPAEVMDTAPQVALPDIAPPVTPALPRPLTADHRSGTHAAPAPPMAMGLPQAPQIDPDTPLPPSARPISDAPVTSLRPVARPQQPTPKAKPPTPAKPTTSTPQQQQPARQSQTAAGNRTGQNAGSSENQSAATLDDAARQSHMAQWGAAIRARVKRRKQYPVGTHASGTAVIHIRLAPTGRLMSATLTSSTADARLDRAAIKAVKSARYPKAPHALSAASYQFNLPISFRK